MQNTCFKVSSIVESEGMSSCYHCDGGHIWIALARDEGGNEYYSQSSQPNECRTRTRNHMRSATKVMVRIGNTIHVAQIT